MNKIIKKLMKRIIENKTLNRYYTPFFYPGHFYSPIPAIDEIKKNEDKIYKKAPLELPAIELNKKEQLELLDELIKYYKDIPFKENKLEDLRYFFENDFYSYSDAIILFCMIRHLKPKNVIEVGSGYSSAIILDTNEMFFNNSINCTFIDPSPERLFSVLKNEDKNRIKIIQKNLQDIPAEEFGKLSEGDILFIDSSHVSKINSDLNAFFFRIFPQLNKGVYIHIHDIFYPFEYPKEWIYEGRAFNEAYILRAFLEYNNAFKIVFFCDFIWQFYGDRIGKEMPLCKKNKGGNIWLKKA